MTTNRKGYMKQYEATHRDRLRVLRHENWARKRLDTLERYGTSCACCGFNDPFKKIGRQAFLQFHHLNGDGYKHARSRDMASLMRWLRKNNFPSGFGILCASCNVAILPGQTACELHKWEEKMGYVKARQGPRYVG